MKIIGNQPLPQQNRKHWAVPRLKRLAAGSAENNVNPNPDLAVGS